MNIEQAFGVMIKVVRQMRLTADEHDTVTEAQKVLVDGLNELLERRRKELATAVVERDDPAQA